jgi:hypothetical protein
MIEHEGRLGCGGLSRRAGEPAKNWGFAPPARRTI